MSSLSRVQSRRDEKFTSCPPLRPPSIPRPLFRLFFAATGPVQETQSRKVSREEISVWGVPATRFWQVSPHYLRPSERNTKGMNLLVWNLGVDRGVCPSATGMTECELIQVGPWVTLTRGMIEHSISNVHLSKTIKGRMRREVIKVIVYSNNVYSK